MNIITGFLILSSIVLSIWVYLDTKKYKQPMRIMGIVWTLTMLWASWIGFWAYLSFGRARPKFKQIKMNSNMDMSKGDKSMSMGNMDMSKGDKSMSMGNMDMSKGDKRMSMGNMDMSKGDKRMSMDMSAKRPKWQGVALSTLHCGAGCTLADIIGESISGVFDLSLAVGWTMDYGLALIIGVYFQYMAIQQMGKVAPKAAIGRALKSDILSLTAWQVGMYGLMSVYYFSGIADGGVSRTSSEFWVVMQVAMMGGFIVSYPMNILLIKVGLKHSM